MARYICKNIVAAGIADICQLQVGYAIGVAKPVSVKVDTFGTGKIAEEKICDLVLKEFDLRPLAIIEKLGLKKPIFKKTVNYGHFGKSGLPWENTDRAEELRKKYMN